MADRQVTMRISLKSDGFRKALKEAADGAGEIADAIREHDRRLGEITRVAFAGAWRADVEQFEMHADVERLPEVDRLLGRCVRLAAQGHGRATADAIDAARSAAAACPEVPALAKDVERIIAILEAS